MVMYVMCVGTQSDKKLFKEKGPGSVENVELQARVLEDRKPRFRIDPSGFL
jgi:hypothetical protein